MTGKNPFFERLKKYVGNNVTVTLKSGGEIRGKLVAINFSTMNFILENKNKNEDYVIRDDISVMTVRRDES